MPALPGCPPGAVGLDQAAIQAAIEYAQTNATPPDQVAYDYSNVHPWDGDPPPHGDAIGPMPDRRGGPSGLILKDGHLIASWGDTSRTDHAFSVAKSFLAVLAGVAFDRGLIDDLDDPVADYIDDGGFAGRNAPITWRQLLHQTSEWQGTLFGKPDTVDRNRPVGRTPSGERGTRDLTDPGSYWEYNDVRINRLALALLRVWVKPLPLVLKHEIMAPIGASDRWEWHGYYNSTVDVDGRPMKSVSGGGHWGGGLWISTRDLARVAQLILNQGTWDDADLLTPDWITALTTPCAENENYGLLWWLNTNQALWPSAPASSFAAYGFGRNYTWIDPEHELVAVVRWLRSPPAATEEMPVLDGFLARLLDAV